MSLLSHTRNIKYKWRENSFSMTSMFPLIILYIQYIDCVKQSRCKLNKLRYFTFNNLFIESRNVGETQKHNEESDWNVKYKFLRKFGLCYTLLAFTSLNAQRQFLNNWFCGFFMS